MFYISNGFTYTYIGIYFCSKKGGAVNKYKLWYTTFFVMWCILYYYYFLGRYNIIQMYDIQTNHKVLNLPTVYQKYRIYGMD